MRVHSALAGLVQTREPIAIAAGFFDGVHLGHQLVLKAAVAHARSVQGQAWVLTFDRHPLSVLQPSKRPELLMTLDQRLVQFEALGFDHALVLPFSRELAVVDPQAFVAQLRGPQPAAEAVLFCGENWRFGRKAEGSPAWIRAHGAAYRLAVSILPYAHYQGEIVSSTRIRHALAEGDITAATAMLSRPYAISGEVIHGKGLADKMLGFATANLAVGGAVVPQRGVYAVVATLPDGHAWPAVANCGLCPTIVEEGALSVEVHVPGLSGLHYGEIWHVDFKRHLRAECHFPSIDALRQQIAADCSACVRAE